VTLAFASAARSETGRVRSHNEDAVLATPRLAAVADGVGGHAAGEVASAAAISALASLEKRWLSGPLEDELVEAIREGNERIGFIASCRPESSGMATTLTVAALEDELVVASIGDSRAYLLRDGELVQLTRDDSLVQDLIDSGTVDAAAARVHPQRNVVLEVLDGAAARAPSVTRHPARAGDRLLVCSDGISDALAPAELSALLAAGDPSAAADALVTAALEAGSRDNVSAVVADAVEGKAPWRNRQGV
jgi:serine/threonine protein phosphatase PrpC